MKKSFPILLTLFAMGGCATTSLSPAPGAQTVPGAANVATSRIDGVAVTAQADAWQGDPAVENTVQPVLVTIRNDGAAPIRIRYGDFALVTPSGHRHAALPPFQVEGALMSPVLASGYGIMPAPRFVYRRFLIAPYFAGIYPGIPVYRGGHYFYDPYYYDFYYRQLAIRPTIEMLSLALPEGVIESGGSVSGYLYFEHVDAGVPMVTFRESLVALGTADAAAGEIMFGEISIPFAVTTSDWP